MWRAASISGVMLALSFLAMAAIADVPDFDEQTLRVGLGSAAGPFDFAIAAGVEQTLPVRAAYEGLVRRQWNPVAGRDELMPELASTWSHSPDGLQWIFRLDTERRFSDGAAVTADAVRFTLNRLLEIGRGSASLLADHIERVEAPNPATVVIVLRTATPLLPLLLADRAASIVNPDIAGKLPGDALGSQYLATHSAGTGPFVLEPIRTRGTYVLTRNRFWASDTRRFASRGFTRLEFRELPDPTVRRLELAKRDIDIAFLLPSQQLKLLQKTPGVILASGTILAFNNLALNTQAPAFRDVRVREAVAYAIDTEGLIRFIKNGVATRISGPLPAGMPGADLEGGFTHYDPSRAVALARAAAVPNDRPIDLIYPGVSPETDTVAQYLQAALSPLGFAVRLERLSIPAYLGRLALGSYDAVLMGFVADFDDPAAIVNHWFDSRRFGSSNPARFENVEVQGLLNRSLIELEPSRRAQLIHGAIAIANAQHPYVYLYQNQMMVALRDDIDGFAFDPVDTLNLPVTAMSRK